MKSRFVQIMSFGETDDQAAMMMEPVGGMDRVVAGFLRKVGHLVQLESQVQKIQLLDRGVEVTYRRNGAVRQDPRRLRAQLHPDAPARRHRAQLPEGLFGRASPPFHAASCSRSVCR